MADETLPRRTNTGKQFGQLALPTAFSQCMQRAGRELSHIQLTLISRTSSASDVRMQLERLYRIHRVTGGKAAVAAPRYRNTSFRPPLTGLEWVKQRLRTLYGRRDVRASQGSIPRLIRRFASPVTKECNLTLEIDSAGGRHSGEMGECHSGATLLCAFDSGPGG